jgi:putative alpha-1,2-mannosidase
VYLIGSPLYPESSLTLSNGKTLRIVATGTSAEQRFVTGATLDGQPLDKAWLRHADLMRGGTLNLTMSTTPGTWPTGAPPPSASDRR